MTVIQYIQIFVYPIQQSYLCCPHLGSSLEAQCGPIEVLVEMLMTLVEFWFVLPLQGRVGIVKFNELLGIGRNADECLVVSVSARCRASATANAGKTRHRM